jgi:hypothetical protein
VLFETFPLRREADENEAAVALHARHLHHRGVRTLRIEIGGIAVLQRHGLEFAVEVIGPAVIAALEFVGRAAIVRDHHRAAMRALIMQRADLAFRIPHDHQRLARDARAEIVAGLLDLALVPYIDPGGREDARHFQFENVRIGVDAAMHARGLHELGQPFRRTLR